MNFKKLVLVTPLGSNPSMSSTSAPEIRPCSVSVIGPKCGRFADAEMRKGQRKHLSQSSSASALYSLIIHSLSCFDKQTRALWVGALSPATTQSTTVQGT